MAEPQYVHGMLMDADHDDYARRRFLMSFKRSVADEMMPGNKAVHDHQVLPNFLREHGRAPESRKELRRAMERHGHHQTWSSLHRLTYEMFWHSVQATLGRQVEDLEERARRFGRRPRGSLRLNPAITPPRYSAALDYHCMPGGYLEESAENDIYQGALYDQGDWLVSMGTRGPLTDAYGRLGVHFLRHRYPDFEPQRILDMGCGIGTDTLPWSDAYPDVELHAIDVGPALLRYGHARTEALGKAVHFSQQNAEATDFPDESFDLVTSCLVIHETSTTGMSKIFRESYRLLKPGGIALHMDGSQFKGVDPFFKFMYDWNTHYNAEPFIGGLLDTDLSAAMKKAGFAPARTEVLDVPRLAEGKAEGTRLGGKLGVIVATK